MAGAALGCLFLVAAHAQTGVVQFKQATGTFSESVGIAVIELERTGSDTDTQITFQTEALTAVPDVDFHPVAETYAFAPGESSVSLAVQIFDNSQREADRQFKLKLSNPVNLTLGSPSEVTITIADNDEATSPGRGAAGTNIFQGIYTLATNSSGAIVAGGLFRTFNGVVQNSLARLLPSGELDTTFATGPGPDNQVWALAVQPDDTILVSGDFENFNGTARSGITRLTATGAIDSGFDPGGGADDRVESIELQSNSQILIGGQFASFNGIPRSDVALLNSNGSIDTSFNAVTPPSFHGHTARRHDDHVLVGGFVAGMDANVTNSLMRFDLTGARDLSFQVSVGDIFFNQVYDIVVQPDLKIVVCGDFLGVNGASSSGIARLNADGTLDDSFDVGTGSDDTIIRIKRQSDGKLIVAGVFRKFNDVPRSGIARLNVDGSLDSTFDPGSGANDFVYNALCLADGGTLAGGAFSQFNGYDRFRLAELNADGSLRTTPLKIVETALEPGPNLHLTLAVEPGRDFRLLSSPSLAGWTSVTTNRTARRSFETTLPAVGTREFFQIEQEYETP